MSVIAVSGANGFVGRHLCRELAVRKHEGRPVSRLQLSSQDLVATLDGVETLVHLAARAHVLSDSRADSLAEFWRVNVDLTRTAGLAALRAGVKRFIFVSSAGVLGATSPREGFRDDSPPAPHDAYTASKLQAEDWLNRELAPNLEVVILRPPLVYGPGARGNLIRLLRLALRGFPLPIGALRAPRSLVAVRNIVDLICQVATAAGSAQGTMLVADREITSVADLYADVARYAGHKPLLVPLPAMFVRILLILSGRGADVARLTGPFELRPSIAQNRFNWSPPYAQQDELQRMVLWEHAPVSSQS